MVKRFGRRRANIPAKYRSGGWVGLAKKAYKGYKYLKSVLNVEHKTYDKYTHEQFGVINNATVFYMDDLTQGVAEYERIGNSVLAKSAQVTAVVKQNSAQTAPVNCRMILFHDKQRADATASDILKTENIDSPLTVENRDRFRILRDIKFSLPIVSQGPDKIIKIFKRLYHHAKWYGVENSDMDEGHVGVLMLSDQGANVPQWYVSTRYRYIDN